MASLLILTQPLQHLVSRLPKVLTAVSKLASKRLYVHLDSISLKQGKCLTLPMKSHIISSIYSVSPAYCPNLDVIILLNGFKYPKENVSIITNESIDQLFIDSLVNKSELSNIVEKYKCFVKFKSPLVLLENDFANELIEELPLTCAADNTAKLYDYVVMGGTLDRMHPGHKILLSECLLRTNKRLTVGVADGPLLKKKLLKELIEPVSVRINKVKYFLSDVDNRIELDVVPIYEPLGPTGWDQLLQMVVVSEETRKGIDLINNHRYKKGLSKLESAIIPIYDDYCKHHHQEEVKYSSSSQRMRLLGTTLQEPVANKNIPDYPYVIGLTGGSASGKTSVGEKLKSLGAAVIHCDELGHHAYAKGTDCFSKLVQVFGRNIVGENGEIDRRALGAIVFQSPDKLTLLNSIVWPEIYKLSLTEIDKLRDENVKTVILDAAVLFEAEWDKFCHEVWVCIINREEAIERIRKRDHKTEEEAIMRINSQMDNEERVAKANVVFCTQWTHDYTRLQVEKAFNGLSSEKKSKI